MKIKILDLNKAGFSVIDLRPDVACIRGHGEEILASRDTEHVIVKVPKFVIPGFVALLTKFNIPTEA